MDKCPACKESLVFPRGHDCHCEDCGWPDEDFSELYGYPKEGERLESYQPNLEFYDDERGVWGKSGVVTATMKGWAKGKYRYKLNLNANPPAEGEE